jgi:hypothetical protein
MRHVCALVFCFGALASLAQTAPTKPHATPSKKPISEYMRQVALSYLEKVDEFKRECYQRNDTCGTAFDARWDKAFEAFEDRITITLSEPRRPAGDAPFYELLKHVKFSTRAYLSTSHLYWSAWEEEKEKHPNSPMGWPVQDELKKKVGRWREVSITCQVLAHSDALDGLYTSTDDQCESKLYQQVHDDLNKDGGVPEAGSASKAPRKEEKPLSPREAVARSWHTQAYCEKDGFIWKDGECHAQ